MAYRDATSDSSLIKLIRVDSIRLASEAGVRESIKWRLASRAGKARYKLRQHTMEPVFGIIKEAMGFRRFLLRGVGESEAPLTWFTSIRCCAATFFPCGEHGKKTVSVRFSAFPTRNGTTQAGSFWTFNRFIFETRVVGRMCKSAAAPSAP